MNIEFLTTSCKSSLEASTMNIEIDEFYIIEEIEPYYKSNKFYISYKEFLALDDKTLNHILNVCRDNEEFHYNIILMLYLLEIEEGKVMRNMFYDKIIDTKLDPYYKLTQDHLHRLIDSGHIAAFLYTVSHINRNDNIDIELTLAQVEFLKKCIIALKESDRKEWKKVLSKIIMDVLSMKKYDEVNIKSTQMFETIQRAFLSSVCTDISMVGGGACSMRNNNSKECKRIIR